MFSPYYHWAGRRDPENHCAVNIGLYGPGASRWTMTERGRSALARDATTLAIGRSALAWDGSALTLSLDEVTAPLPRRVRGTVRLIPHGLGRRAFALDAAGRHRWMPLAPSAHVEVAFTAPDWRWSGHGYWDTNAGDEPVAAGFRTWDWSRADLGDGASAVLYDTRAADGSERSLAVLYTADGSSTDFAAPPRQKLGRTLWGLPRSTQADGAARVSRTLEDTPFYARSVLDTQLLGRRVTAVHETLSATRFNTPIVRAMLPFRMPRRGG